MSSDLAQRGPTTLEEQSTKNELESDDPSRIRDDHENKSDKRQSHLDTESASEEERIEITVYDGNTLDDKPVKLDIKSDDEGEDTPTLPLKKNKQKEMRASQEESKEKVPIYIFPILRLKLAWTRSSNAFEFLLKAIAIIFSTLGWLCCVGGVPLMSLVMLIIGAIYVDDCYIEPNIPIYLIVSGVFGTLQHFIGVWTKYIPKESQGRMKVYRAYCKVVDHTIQGFLFIWFIIGCIWVYGVHSKVEFNRFYEQEYCNKTVYYFAFWVLNLSFILMSILVVVTFACILFVVLTKEKSENQY